ncbi:MAG TPA: hypothetical protein DDY71_16745 [Spirochaetia bacterium]|nr:hypothetical protein [Spirochaetia bacterium]
MIDFFHYLNESEKRHTMKKDLVGFCGLYCGACDNYLAFTKEKKDLLSNEKFQVSDIETLSCSGCHTNKLTEHCSKCLLRKCAMEKEIDSCGFCQKYPCDDLKKFQGDGLKWQGARHRVDVFKNIEQLTDTGIEKWIQNQENKWKCDCGLTYSYYEKKCNRCGKELCSYAEETSIRLT